MVVNSFLVRYLVELDRLDGVDVPVPNDMKGVPDLCELPLAAPVGERAACLTNL